METFVRNAAYARVSASSPRSRPSKESADMEQYVNVSIDGAEVRAVKGATVLDTAVEYGICIPHLCHVPGLSDMGACRLCIVENVVNGKGKITASCTLNVQEGMVVLANTERVKNLRRNLAELLVAQAPNSR